MEDFLLFSISSTSKARSQNHRIREFKFLYSSSRGKQGMDRNRSHCVFKTRTMRNFLEWSDSERFFFGGRMFQKRQKPRYVVYDSLQNTFFPVKGNYLAILKNRLSKRARWLLPGLLEGGLNMSLQLHTALECF